MHLDYAAVHKSKKGLRRWVIIGLSRWLVIEGQKSGASKKTSRHFREKVPICKVEGDGTG